MSGTMQATESPRERQLRGHDTRRYELPMQNDSSDVKLCECGCGQPAPIATYTKRSRGYITGQPVRFVSGHNNRGRMWTAETRAKLAAAVDRTSPRGEGSPNWKGGVHYQRGRKKVYVGREHPMADKGGYVFEHRLVAAATIGRMLASSEHVHHIDLDETNSDPTNLVVVSNSQHRRIHWLIHRGASPSEAVQSVLA